MTTLAVPRSATKPLNPLALEAICERLDWRFTQPQWDALSHPTRFVIYSGGERGGKSDFASKWLTCRIVEVIERVTLSGEAAKATPGKVLAIFWLVAADYERTRQEFLYLSENLLRLYGRDAVKPSGAINPGLIEIKCGAGVLLVRTKSSSDETTLVMEAPDAIVMCEASQISHNAYQ